VIASKKRRRRETKGKPCLRRVRTRVLIREGTEELVGKKKHCVLCGKHESTKTERRGLGEQDPMVIVKRDKRGEAVSTLN